MKFTKPKGSTADLREIEYISALHQTGDALRKNGTINSDDISLFLMSRYGIVADAEEISNSIMQGFGGGGISESDGDTMDLTEVVAMLLIPTLLRAKRGMKGYGDVGGGRSVGRGSNAVDDFNLNSSGGQEDPDIIDADMSFDADEVAGPSAQPNNNTNSNKRNIFQYVLQMILADTIHTTSPPPPLTVDLLRSIFLFYGEKDVASHSDLMQGMVDLALNAGENLNAEVFAHCCTSDVDLYNPEWEGSLTSTYVDVFETHSSTKKEKIGSSARPLMEDVEYNSAEVKDGEKGEERVNEVLKKYTFPAIDYAVDTFRSKTFVILLWFTWVTFYLNFIGVLDGNNNELGLQCGDYSIETARGFWCAVGQGVVKWLKVMLKLVVLGSFFIIGASIGHSTNPHTPLLIVVSMGFICLYTFVPLATEVKVLPSSDGLYSELHTVRVYTDYNIFLTASQFSVGTMLMLFCLQNILDRSLPTKFLEKHRIVQQVLASGSLYMERNMKKAASFKIKRMIRNALEIHDAAARDDDSSGKESAYGKALLSYSKVSDATEEVGGHWWTWSGLITGRLFEEEGIWLSNRVMQGNLGQLFLCVLLIPMIIEVNEGVRELYQYAFTYFEIPFPEEWRILVPISVGFIFAEINSLGLVSVYIPSTIRTTFRFRYGAIGSLHDNEFQKMRRSMEQATFIFGSMFWGCFLSNVIVLFTTWCVATVSCFPSFRPNLLKFLSTLIGLVSTILLKQSFFWLARSKFSGQTFYRSSPAAANCIGVLLEAWNLGVSVLFVFIRMVTLVFTAFIYVARVDIPFLSESADEVGGFVIDGWPFIFRKDMLQHEAHRHPYLERIGVMYMMKLRYGDRFGNHAGTSWRLLFVYALFPWLRKYRIRGGDELLTTNETKSTLSRKSLSHSVSSKGESEDTESLKNEIERLKSENDHLRACLEESNTKGDF